MRIPDWIEHDGLVPVFTDAFGGLIYEVVFDRSTPEDPDEGFITLSADVLADLEHNAEELPTMEVPTDAYLVIFPNGTQIWTRTSLEFAKDILARRDGKRQPEPSLFG